MHVLVQIPANVLSPYEAMQRADHLNIQRRRLLQQRLHLYAILSDDICIVPSRLIEIVAREIDLVCEKCTVQRTKCAERIRREQDLIRRVIRNHDLRPVHHRRRYKDKIVLSGAEIVPFLYEHDSGVHVKREELLHHLRDLCVADDLHLRIPHYDLPDRLRVIRLHVMHDEIIELPSIEHLLDIFKKDTLYRLIHGVQQYRLLIHQQIRIVRNASRDLIYTLKQRQPAVISSDPVKILRHFSIAIHDVSSCLFLRINLIFFLTSILFHIFPDFKAFYE